jgi:hypothetical protein
MTATSSRISTRPLVEWENEGGALAPTPVFDMATAPAEPGGSLALLGAVTALWRDLSPGARGRIACDAMVVMRKDAPSLDPGR